MCCLDALPARQDFLTALHNTPITNGFTGNLAIAEVDLNHFAPRILQRLCNTLLTKRDDVIWRFFETMAAIMRLTIECSPDTLARSDLPRRSAARRSSSTPSPT